MMNTNLQVNRLTTSQIKKLITESLVNTPSMIDVSEDGQTYTIYDRNLEIHVAVYNDQAFLRVLEHVNGGMVSIRHYGHTQSSKWINTTEQRCIDLVCDNPEWQELNPF